MMPWEQTFLAWEAWLWDRRWYLTAGYLVALIISCGIALWRRRATAPTDDGWGSAHWATARELRQLGAYNHEGMMLGIFGGQYVRSPIEQSVVVFGGPGTGKSRGNAIPTILASPHSCLIVDLSGDLVARTSRYRASLGPTFVWDPTSGYSHHLNPWDLVPWRTVDMIEYTQRLSSHVVKPLSQHSSAGSEHYERVADDLLSLASLHLGLSTGSCNGEDLLQFFSPRRATVRAILAQLEASEHKPVARGAARVLQQSQSRLLEQWAAAAEWLTRWEDPKLAWNTHNTDIPWQDFQRGPEPMTLYLRLTPDDASNRLNRLLRMVLDLLMFALTEKLAEGERFPLNVDVVMDDVAELGDFDFPGRVASFKRKYGWRLMAIFQSPVQAQAGRSRYSPILPACGCSVIHRQNDQESAQYVCDRLGDMTVHEPAERVTRRWGQRTRTDGMQSHRRPLMTADEIMRLRTGEVIMIINGLRVKGYGIDVYSDAAFEGVLDV